MGQAKGERLVDAVGERRGGSPASGGQVLPTAYEKPRSWWTGALDMTNCSRSESASDSFEKPLVSEATVADQNAKVPDDRRAGTPNP